MGSRLIPLARSTSGTGWWKEGRPNAPTWTAQRSAVGWPVAALIALGALLVFCLSNGAGATTVPGGNITAPASWTQAESPYYLEGDLTVDPGASLSVEPGVTVFVNGSYSIVVYGSLAADGSASSPISFEWNGSATWAGLRLVSNGGACTMANVTIGHAVTALRITTPAAPVTISDLRLDLASARSLLIENSAAAVRIVGLTIASSYEGILLSNVTGLVLEGYQADRFTYSGAWAIRADTLRESLLRDIFSAEAEFRLAGVTNVTMRNVTIPDPEENWPLMVYGGVNLNVDGFAHVGEYAIGPYIDRVVGLVMSNLTIHARTYWPYGESVHIERSPAFRVVGASITNAYYGIAASYSPYFVLQDIDVTDGDTGVSALRCGRFQMDGARITNMSSWGVYIEFSDAASIANTAITNASTAFRVGASGGLGELDVSQGNTIDAVPVLGIYNQSGRTVSIEGYSWVFVWGSPGTTLLAGNMTRLTSDVQAVIGNSSGTRMTGATIVGSRAALYVYNSPNTTVEWSNLTAYDQAIYGYFTSGLIVRNSTLQSTGPFREAVGGPGLSDSLFEDSQITAGGSPIQDMGSRNIYRRLNLTGARNGFESVYSGSLLLEDSVVCKGISLGTSTRSAVVRNVTICPEAGTGVTLSDATGAVIENSSFEGLSTAIRAPGAYGSIIRWNEFRNCGVNAVSVGAAPSVQLIVYENAFYCGALSASDNASATVLWYNATRLRGNYWDDYSGPDANGDVIGDTPYAVPGANRTDPYPLMAPLDVEPPIAQAGSNFTVEGDRPPANLNGSLSTDNRGITLAYWMVYETATPVRVDGLTANYAFAALGVFEARLVVEDAWHLQSSASIFISVVDTIGPSWSGETQLEVPVEEGVLLSSLAATDISGVAGVAWSLDGDLVSTVGLYLATPSATSPLSIQLRLTDGQGNVATYDLTVTGVDATAPTLTRTDLAAERAVRQNEVLAFNATGAFWDNDPSFNSTASYVWNTSAAGVSWVGPAAGRIATAQFANEGDFVLTLSVADAAGNVREVSIPVHVTDGVAPSNITWVASPSGVVAPKTTISFVASASDAGGVSIRWNFGDGQTAQGSSVSHAYTSAGNWTITVTATDPAGNEANITFEVAVKETVAGDPVGGEFPTTIVVVAGAAAAAGAVAFALIARRRRAAAGPTTPAAEISEVASLASDQEYERLYGTPPPPQGPPPL